MRGSDPVESCEKQQGSLTFSPPPRGTTHGTRRATHSRVVISLMVAFTAGIISWQWWGFSHPSPSDFAQSRAGAEALLRGISPWDVVGPGKPFEWRFPLLYPMPAVLFAVPFSLVPLRLADALFVALGAGLLAWGLTKHRIDNPQLVLFGSICYFLSLQISQWAPLLMGATLTSGFGVLLACKPTVAVALFAARPRWSVAMAVAGVYLASLLAFPWWLSAWLQALPSAQHMTPPVGVLGGGFVLLALLKWKRAEARLLVAMACLPHTVSLYESVPLFLVVRTWPEAVMLWGCTALSYAVWQMSDWGSFEGFLRLSSQWVVWLVYLPCTVLVLRRRNEWSDLLERATIPACSAGAARIRSSP